MSTSISVVFTGSGGTVTTAWLPAVTYATATSIALVSTFTNMDGSQTTITSWTPAASATPSQVYQGPIGGYVPNNGQQATSSNAYLQSVIISLIALAVILVVSIIFLYYRRQRLHRYAAADWPFPAAFRSTVRGGAEIGEKPTMWEVEVGEEGRGMGAAHEEKGGGAEWRPLSAHAIPPADTDTVPPTPPTPAARNPTPSRNPLSRFRQRATLFPSPAPAEQAGKTLPDSASDDALAPAPAYTVGTQLQVSVLIAMPVPPAVAERRRSRAASVSLARGVGGEPASSHADAEDELELPDMQLGYAEMRIGGEGPGGDARNWTGEGVRGLRELELDGQDAGRP